MYDINKDNKIKISSSIIINATPEKVWSILKNINDWSEWTRFVASFEGDFRKNGNIKVVFNTPEGLVPFNRKLVIFEENKVFCWEGDAMMPGSKDHHVFHLAETADGKTELTQADGFHGITRTPEIEAAEKQMEGLYALMNQELKTFVES